MWGMPFDATHEQIDNIQQQLAEAARAQDALKNPWNQVAFVDNYKQLAWWGKREDEFPIPWSENTGNQRFNWFPMPSIDNQKTWIEIWNDVNDNLTKFGAKIENWKLHLVNWKQINVLWNTEKISVTSFMQEKRLDWDTYMTLRVDNKDWTHQLAHFATWPNWDELILEKNWVRTTVYDIDKTLKWPEIASDVNSCLKTFWAKLEDGKISLPNWKILKPDDNVSKISIINYAQAKTLDWPASMTLKVDNKDNTVQLLHFSTWVDWDKLVFEKNWKQTQWYNIPRS